MAVTLNRPEGAITLTSEEAKQVWLAVEQEYNKKRILSVMKGMGQNPTDGELLALANKAIDSDAKLEFEDQQYVKIAIDYAKKKRIERENGEIDMSDLDALEGNCWLSVAAQENFREMQSKPAVKSDQERIQGIKDQHNAATGQNGYEKYRPGMDPLAFFKNHESKPEFH